MAVETFPSREFGSHREVRQAVGRQLTRIVLFCALSLVAGIGIGQYFVRQQLQVQQGVVGQLQREIRGLTGDIQRLEVSNAHSLSRCEQIVDRLEHSQRGELSGEFQRTQQRLESLERLVQRQVDDTHSAQAACLAEFEPYRRKHLAVPVDLIAEALDRLVAGRTENLRVLVDEIRAQAEQQKSRLATLHGDALLGSSAGAGDSAPEASALMQPLPAFPFSGAESAPVDLAEGEASEAGESTPILQSSAVAASAESIPLTLTLPAAAAVEESRAAAITAAEITPIPDATVPAPRAMIGPPGRRRPYTQLLCFASGRRVETPAPMRRSSPLGAVPAPVTSAQVEATTELR